MGCDHYFHLISAAKYIKQLRPKLLRYYGPVNRSRALRFEVKRVQIADVLKKMFNRELRHLPPNPYSETFQKAPLHKHLKVQRQNTQQLYQQIEHYLDEHAPCFFDTRNNFLRMEDFLQQMDSFEDQGPQIKVSNMIQVENYLKYLEAIKKTLEKEPECEYSQEYQGVDEAEEIFTSAYEKMKENNGEFYLYYRKSN